MATSRPAALSPDAISLVLEFLASKNFTEAETALRAQLEREASSEAAPDAEHADVSGKPALSKLESLLIAAPAASNGRRTVAARPDLPHHGPLLTPVFAQAPVAFYQSAQNPGDDEWTDDEDLGYRRVASTEEALWSSAPSTFLPPTAAPGAHTPAAGAAAPTASPPAAPPPLPAPRAPPAARDPAFEIFPNLNVRSRR